MELNLEALDARYAKLRVGQRRQEARLLLSIQEHGQRNAISVVKDGEGRYVVIDGHKRVRVLKRLKCDVVKAMVVEMPVGEALVSVYQMASGSGFNVLEEGWLVHELHRVIGWELGKVAVGMDRSKSWVSRRLGLVESLPESVQEKVQRGMLGAHAAVTYLLPLSRGNGSGCEKLAEKIGEARLTSREIGVLCRHYGLGRSQAAAKILEDPVRFLKALERAKQGEQDLGLSDSENRCLNNLGLVGNVCLGLARLWRRVMNYDTPEGTRRKLLEAFQRSRERWDDLEHAVAATLPAVQKEAEEHAGSSDADSDFEAASTRTQQPQDSQGFESQPQ